LEAGGKRVVAGGFVDRAAEQVAGVGSEAGGVGLPPGLDQGVEWCGAIAMI
jgi:hypothetical protein